MSKCVVRPQFLCVLVVYGYSTGTSIGFGSLLALGITDTILCRTITMYSKYSDRFDCTFDQSLIRI